MASLNQPEQHRLLTAARSQRSSPSPSRSPSPSPTPSPLPKSQPIRQRKRDRFREYYRTLFKHSRLGLLWSILWVDHEEPKIILSHGHLLVLLRSWFHFLALSMTVILSYLHISGFYIGGTLEAWHGNDSESTKLLLLQVSAKLLELIVIASLATVVVDIVRSLLIGGSIPFGWIAAHRQFADPLWFFSEEFWAAGEAFPNKLRFTAIAVFLAACGAFALLTGPATALLLIPAWRTNWYAGGTDYWLAGNASVLWPQRLTIASAGGGNCLNPSTGWIKTAPVSQAGCIWAGYNGLRADYFDAHQQQGFNVTLTDGFQRRLLQRVPEGIPEPLTIAPFAAVTAPTFNFGQSWTSATSAIKGVGSYAHYQRNSGGTVFKAKSQVPIVRASCFQYINFTLACSSVNATGACQPMDFDIPPGHVIYPYLPEYGSAPGVYYFLPNHSIFDSNLTAAYWRQPNATYTLSNGTISAPSPSLFMNLQIPSNGVRFGNYSSLMTCSVDARWINSTNLGISFDAPHKGRYSVLAQLPDIYYNPPPLVYFPETREYVRVTMDDDWLGTLLPLVTPTEIPGFNSSDYPGYNTLADIMSAMRLNDGFTAVFAVKNQIEGLVATVIADGMSRIGYANNGGSISLSGWQSRVVERYNISFDSDSQWSKALYRGTASTGYPAGWDASNTTKQRVDIYIQGYSYKADSAAIWLALALLYVYTIIVLSHITYRCAFAVESSVAWESTTDLIALAFASDPPQREGDAAFKNTCGGVDSFRTLSTPIAARALQGGKDGQLQLAGEQVRLFVAEEAQLRHLVRIKAGESYGAVDVT